MIHDTAQHLTEDELHDAADGTQSSGAAGRATRHLVHCAHCRADVERIRELLALAASLPRSIEPPADLWPEIRTRIAGGAGGAAPAAAPQSTTIDATDAVHRAHAGRARWDSLLRDRRWLAAAAVLLIAISSAVTTLVIRNDSPAIAGAAPDSVEMPGDDRPAAVQRVSDDYERLDRELASMLAASRDRLQPETVDKVDRNLAIIDAAIAEIRQALAEDPGNDALVQLLKASYGQKSALVRQVSAS